MHGPRCFLQEPPGTCIFVWESMENTAHGYVISRGSSWLLPWRKQRKRSVNYDDTSKLCRTGLDDVSGTKMTTLTFIFHIFLSYLPLNVKTKMPSILNTNTNILMRLYVSTEEVVTKYEIYGGSCVHIPPHTHK